MDYQEIANLIDTTSDNVPRFITKKCVEIHDQSGSALKSDLCDFSDAYIVVKGTITLTDPNDANYEKKLALKIMHHFFLGFQKLIIQF